MTDKIIEALQELYNRLLLNYNDGVQFEQLEEDRLTVNNTLDIVNRQQAEIERLKAKCENTQIGYNFAKADIERLNKELIEKKLRKEMLHYTVEEVKAEAIKEFAEELKQRTLIQPEYNDFVKEFLKIIHRNIDNLVKEMVGEE